MDSRNGCIPSFSAPFSLSNSKGSPLALYPWAGHMSFTSHMVVEEAALGMPVVSVLVDNGSLVSCCGALQ